MAINVSAARGCGFFLGLLSILLFIIATPTHHWFINDLSAASTGAAQKYGGVWEECTEYHGGEYTCKKVASEPWLNAVKAFLILTIIDYIIVIVYISVMLWARGLKTRICGILLFFAGVCSLIAVSVYTGQHNLAAGYAYSWSYILVWCGTFFTFITAALCFFADPEYASIR